MALLGDTKNINIKIYQYITHSYSDMALQSDAYLQIKIFLIITANYNCCKLYIILYKPTQQGVEYQFRL